MNIIEISQKFPNEIDVVRCFESIRWGKKSVCAYCGIALPKIKFPHKEAVMFQKSSKLAVVRREVLFCAFSLFCLFFAARDMYADFGKSGWTIFQKAQSVRSAAITSATPVTGDLSGVFYNPAVLGTDTQQEIFFLSEIGASEDKLGGFVYGMPLKSGMLSVGAVYFDAGQMELNWLDAGGNLLSENVTSQRDMLGIISYGHKFSGSFYSGLSLKVATSEIAERDSSLAYAGDLGVLFMPAEKLNIAAAIQNIGSSTKFLSESNPLPTAGYIGGSYVFDSGKLRIVPAAGVIYNLTDKETSPEVGAEIGYGLLSLNAGYRLNADESNLLIGFILNLRNIDIGYAYIPGQYLNATHRVNIGLKFEN